MEKYIDLEKIAAEYDPNKTSPAEQRLADVVVAAIRELAPNAVEQSGKKGHEYGVYTQEELETPLTFEAKEDGTKIYFLAYKARKQTRTIEVSTDNGKTWTEFTSENYDGDNNTPIATLNIGQRVLVRGNNPNGMGYYDDDEGTASAGAFRINGEAYTYGNVMSLLSKDDFATMRIVPVYAFARLFCSTVGNWHNDGSLLLHQTKRLLLPANTLAPSCYSFMFEGCTSLTNAPELPATTLADYCYRNIFGGCTSLTSAPKLPATTLASECYSQMFQNCASLTIAPELPATTLAEGCYYLMFDNCTSLTSGPELPAMTLNRSCYYGMFSGCTSLTTAPKLPATTLAEECYQRMFYCCTSLMTASELPAIALASSCYSQMFYGCTRLAVAPELPATTLMGNCYDGMFYNCTSLTSAPELPATTLVAKCYRGMFENCYRINFIKAAFTTTPGIGYTQNWVKNVFPNGLFLKKGSWSVTGNDGIPDGWTARSY